jgi:hypothetical protein
LAGWWPRVRINGRALPVLLRRHAESQNKFFISAVPAEPAISAVVALLVASAIVPREERRASAYRQGRAYPHMLNIADNKSTP